MTESVTIRSIAGGGDGVATLADGRTVFVPRSAPGDQLRLTDIRTHARFARAAIAAIEVPGPDRVTPPCPHYTAQRCGGCQLMHLAPAAQARIKGTIAGDALRRIAGLEVADPVIEPSPVPLHYRSKMTLALAQGRLGYHPLGDARAVFDLRECLLVEPVIRDLHAAISPRRSLLPVDTRRVVFRRDRDGGQHVVVESGGKADWSDPGRLRAQSGVKATLWWQRGTSAPRAVAGPAGSWPATIFEQVNPAMGAQVRVHALDQAGTVAGAVVWDLYAGMGETTRELAHRGATVESVEMDAAAVTLAERLGPAGPRRLTMDVSLAIPQMTRPAVVITNPPRGGMDADVVDGIAHAGAGRIVYISCDPATLARDIRRLGDGYRLTDVRAFDQFPQTAHLETVAVLERR